MKKIKLWFLYNKDLRRGGENRRVEGRENGIRESLNLLFLK